MIINKVAPGTHIFVASARLSLALHLTLIT